MGLLFYVITGSNVTAEKGHRTSSGGIGDTGDIKHLVSPAPSWTVWATLQIFRGY